MLCSLLVIKKDHQAKIHIMSDHVCVIVVQTLAVLYYFCLFIVNNSILGNN